MREPYRLVRNRAWEDRFPGLRCGITAARTEAGKEADFGLGGPGSLPEVLEGYRLLAEQLGFEALTVPRQVHGSEVVSACAPSGSREGGRDVVAVREGADGLLCSSRGLLLAITAADCVPVHLLAPAAGAFALLHAGWRGTAAGVFEAGLRGLREAHGVTPREIHAYLGPAICGDCYEVGPEVFAALGMSRDRGALDLRKVLADRATRAGVPIQQLSVSGWCTCCASDRFHSHRGSGQVAGRMAAYMGFRAEEGG